VKLLYGAIYGSAKVVEVVRVEEEEEVVVHQAVRIFSSTVLMSFEINRRQNFR
jgi:hypothetical protein